MLVITLSIFLCLGSVSASAFSNDFATLVGDRLIGQQGQTAIEGELAIYLEDDDIAGARAFVNELAEHGEISEEERQALLNQIWRTKTERTLDYARKIREAIRNSDLETMRAYNARMQRLTTEPEAGTAEADAVEDAEADVPEEAQADAQEEDVDAIVSEPESATAAAPELKVDDQASVATEPVRETEPDTTAEIDPANVIADLLLRGEAAIEADRLTIARRGADSAIGMVDALLALGDEGKPAAEALGLKTMARYQALIERDIGRGQIENAKSLAERMGEVAKRAGLPTDQVDALRVRIEEISVKGEEHSRLMSQAVRLRDQGKLVTPDGEHALASAANALKVGVQPAAARDLLDSIILRQRQLAGRLAEAGRFRDAAGELNMLADALLTADIDQTALVADSRAKAAALYRQADIRDSERERSAAAARPAPAAPEEDDEPADPFTFINPF